MAKNKTAQKWDKHKQDKVPVSKEKYKVGGSVTRGFTVLELDGGEIVFSCENMWDAIDRCRALNTPA